MPENDYGRPGPAEPPEYWYVTCPRCDGDFPPDSAHIHEDDCKNWDRDDPGPQDPHEFVPEGWMWLTPELADEMTEFYEQQDEQQDQQQDRLEDC